MWKINLNPIKNVENKPEFDKKCGKQTLIRSKIWKTNLNQVKNVENKPDQIKNV